MYGRDGRPDLNRFDQLQRLDVKSRRSEALLVESAALFICQSRKTSTAKTVF